jgi:hypothetical protein
VVKPAAVSEKLIVKSSKPKSQPEPEQEPEPVRTTEPKRIKKIKKTVAAS